MSTYILDKEKYKNVILYLSSKIGKRKSIYGKKKLYKLFYFLDFDSFEKYGKPITGDIYRRIDMGPAPRYLDAVVCQMEQEGSLKVNTKTTGNGLNDTIVYTALEEPDLDIFSAQEIRILDRVVDKYGDKTGRQLENISHREAPYIAVDDMEEMPLELSYYRGTDFSDL